MLRFRPIAPKPAAADWAPTGTAELQRRGGTVVAANGRKRMKRKYVRVVRRRTRRSQAKMTTTSSAEKSAVESGGSSTEKKALLTLELLPNHNNNNNNNIRKNSSFFTPLVHGGDIVNSQKTSSLVASSVKESWVIVECVTEIFNKLGFSNDDKDKIKRLEADTCPGFVSDGGNSVVWVNDAYRKMGGGYCNELTVRLAVKETLPHFCPSFACRATLIQQTWRGQKWNRIFHCDVWRMEKFEGFAWRMDLDTSIGLGC